VSEHGPHGLVAALKTIVGDDGVLVETHDIQPFRGDIGLTAADTDLIVVRPRSTDALSAIVKVCGMHGVAITPRGGGSGFCGGAVPSATGLNVVVSFERMRRIRAVDTVNDVLVVEAGCTLHDAQEAAKSAGRLLGVDHGGAGSSQIGGNLGTNAGGNNVLRYGMARDQVLGLEVVLADGSVISRLSPLRKSNVGYDLKQMFLGSEGTLGLITAATLRLRPAPVKRATACLAVESPEQALRFLDQGKLAFGESISAFELMSGAAVALHMKHAREDAWPGGEAVPWLILLEADSASSYFDLDAALTDLLDRTFESGLVKGGTVASSEAQRFKFWRIREGIASAMVATPGCLKSDTAVPISQIPQFIFDAGAAVKTLAPGCVPAPFGHLGDGNIHFNVLPPMGEPPELFQSKWKLIQAAIATVSLSLDGTVSAEHGIGLTKKAAMAEMMGPVEMHLMRSLKRAWDPYDTLNQGKLFE
jgi:FAD/FMN-containing dehydrogenase